MFGQPLEVNLLAVITSVYVHTPEYSPIGCKPTTIVYIASTAAGVIAVVVIQVWYVVYPVIVVVEVISTSRI